MSDGPSGQIDEPHGEPPPTTPESEAGPTNIFYGLFNEHGIPTELPDNYRSMIHTVEGEKLNDLTGLPELSDTYRRDMTARLGQAIRNNEGFVCIYGDADQVKQANDLCSRDLGDAVIKSGAGAIGEIVSEFNKGAENTFMYRGSGGADETVLIIFGLDEEEVNTLHSRAFDLSNKRTTITIPEGVPNKLDGKYDVTTSTAIVSSDDRRLQESLAATKVMLEENSEAMPWNTMRLITNTADAEVHIQKTVKEIRSLDMQELGEADSVAAFAETMRRVMTGKRIGPFLAPIITKFLILVGATNNLTDRSAEYINHATGLYVQDSVDEEGNPRSALADEHDRLDAGIRKIGQMQGEPLLPIDHRLIVPPHGARSAFFDHLAHEMLEKLIAEETNGNREAGEQTPTQT